MEHSVENSDNALDMRLERRLKRRCLANHSFKKSSRPKGIQRTPTTAAVKASGLEKCGMMKTPQPVLTKDEQQDVDYNLYLNELGNSFNSSLADDDLDPHYQMFWENLREDGTSYFLELAMDEDITVLLKYEEDNWSGEKGKPGSPDNLKTGTKRKNMENPKKASSKGLQNMENPKKASSKGLQNMENPKKASSKGLQNMENPKKASSKGLQNMENPKKASSNGLQNMENPNKASSKGLPSSGPLCKDEPEPFDIRIDESYKTFLECLKQESNCAVFVNKHGKRQKYEEESETESGKLAAEGDPVIGEREKTSCTRSKPFGSSRARNRNGMSHSPFRDKLMVSLTKPYDKSEHEELWREVCERKPLERQRELRGQTKSYALEICSKSYLDHHTDLKRKIDAVRDNPCKTLNLLRGFFYWLKNLSHEGAFQPWCDPSCLNVIPEQ